jgi:hypothetical protein
MSAFRYESCSPGPTFTEKEGINGIEENNIAREGNLGLLRNEQWRLR